MFTTRRHFLKKTFAGSSLVACGLSVPRFLTHSAAATPGLEAAGGKETILVVIQLTGGNDGLNTVIPWNDPLYAAARPTLKQKPQEVKKLTDEIALHPAMAGFAELWQDRALGIVQGVGYPNPNQSHFTSMDIWHSARLTGPYSDGWLGRALGQLPSAAGQGYHLGNSSEASPLALAGPVKCPTVTNLADLELRTLGLTGSERKAQRESIESNASSAPKAENSLLDFVQRTAVGTFATAKRLREIAKQYEPKVPYPQNRLAERLKLAAQLIDAEIGARVYYLEQDNYDTHANQAGTHAQLLGELSSAVTAFYQDIKARGHAQRVLILTFSEFGRRVKENGSHGTDHGAAAPVFLIGGKVKPGLAGTHPRLDQLDDGNLKFQTDFRGLYATLLDEWLGVSSRAVLSDTFAKVKIFA
jgi:uncharacterized protein (DUF1501 family)